ncbi:MAG: adenosylmethionine--8-amino-7-oxononanoate transaminase [Planctomycetota bacterium]
MSDIELANRTDRLWLPYCQMKTMATPFEVSHTSGTKIFLKDGTELIDGIASWWTACHGYNHPHIVEAIQHQAQRMPHVMLGGLVHEPAMRLAVRLSEVSGFENGKVFLSDSGSVAVEIAMKMTIQHWRNLGNEKKIRFLCFRDSYHGDTVGAMSLCDPVDSMHSRFKGFLLEQYSQPIPELEQDLDRFESFVNQHADEIAGVIIEPLIQMAAGMRFHSPEVLAQLFSICKRAGLVFIADEVATGFGRTGSLLAVQQANIQPDIMCVGKALSGGTLPIAATLASDEIYRSFHSDDFANALMHGPTFMGNPLACSAANASLDLFETGAPVCDAMKLESQMMQQLEPLKKVPSVVDVRCRGAVGVVEFNHEIDVTNAIPFFVEHGVWLRPLRNTVYLAPSFNIEKSDLIRICQAIEKFANR